jgi:hypothetical protein
MVHKDSNAKVTVWHRGFKYTLTNGYTLSVAFGPGNNCDNCNLPFDADESWYESSNFEVAVFEPNDEVVDLVRSSDNEWTDQVIGWVPASALPLLISALKFWDVRPKFTGEEPDLPGDVAAARRRAVEDFEKTLRARCRMFHNICKDYKDRAAKEAKKDATSV